MYQTSIIYLHTETLNFTVSEKRISIFVERFMPLPLISYDFYLQNSILEIREVSEEFIEFSKKDLYHFFYFFTISKINFQLQIFLLEIRGVFEVVFVMFFFK